MNREDTDRILSIRCGNCFPAARFVPPFQETVQVCALLLGIFGHHIQESLDKNLLIFGKVVGKKAEQTFRYFIEGLAGKEFAGQRRLPVEKPEFRHQISLSTLDRNIKRSARSSDLRGSSGNATKKP